MTKKMAGGQSQEQFMKLVSEVRQAFHRLGDAAEQLHAASELTGGQRAMLEDLHLNGPQTMPDLAGKRPVSRQHIRGLVLPLKDAGLVEYVENPEHKRSKLVQLTSSGRKVIADVVKRERRALARLRPTVSDTELGNATYVLREISELFQSDAWSAIVSKETGR